MGASKTIIEGQNNSRLFDITSEAGDVTFEGLTLTGGQTTADFEDGGAIRSLSNGTLTVKSSTLTSNGTTGDQALGGAIFAEGDVTIINSTLSHNFTGGNGGGIRSEGLVTVTGSTISNNTSGVNGAGISGIDRVIVTNSTISGNLAAQSGGGIAATNVRVVNSTVFENSAGNGGGLFATEMVALENSIVAGNEASLGQPDIRALFRMTAAFSLIGDNSGTPLDPAPIGSPDPDGNLVGTPNSRIDPQLGPLADNGGPTLTHHPLAGSPVIDAGDNSLAIDAVLGPLTIDQRSFARIFNSTVDMGALESQPTFPWHNFAKPFDVSGGLNNQPDGFIVADDALAIINYLNAFAAGAVPANAALGLPFGFVDVSGGPNGVGDNFITAGDALDIINFINAGLGGEGEHASAEVSPATFGAEPQPVTAARQDDWANLIALLALDTSQHHARRRASRR